MQITKIQQQAPVVKKPRVCAYIRVSTNHEEQASSYLAQSEYWSNKLSSDDSVEYVGIFADKGVSGKTMANRIAVNEMFKKVRNGEIDKIFVKSISRLSRNHHEAISIIREFKELGVPIFFEKENIESTDPKCALLLNVYASLAEEELNSMSKNQKWAARKRFANGSVELTSILGYHYYSGKLTVIPTEAETVRRIFELCAEGNGTVKIAQILEQEKRLTKHGSTKWHRNNVACVLKNEKYIGDCLMQKTYIENFKAIKNKGELPMYYIENSHEAIVTKELFEKVQKLRHERAEKYKPKDGVSKYGYAYPLSGKITCGQCGKGFKRKTCAKGKPYEKICWICMTKEFKTVKACNAHDIKDEVVKDLLCKAYNECLEHKFNAVDVAEQKAILQNLLMEEHELKELRVKGYLSEEQYKRELGQIIIKIEKQEEKITELQKNNIDLKAYKKSAVYLDSMADFLSKAIVKDWTVTFQFNNGYEITKTYTNGRAGNVNGKLKRKT